MLGRLQLLCLLIILSVGAKSQCPVNEADLADGGTFSGTCSVNVGNTITVTGDIIWQSGTLTISDAENELAGFIISGTGSLTVQSGSVIIDDTDGAADDSNIVVQNGGTLTIENGGTLRVEEDVTIETGGVATVDFGGALDIGNDPTGGEFNVAGTLNVSGSISTTGTGANGNLEANGGTINIFSGGFADVSDDLKAYNGGTIYVETGGQIDVADNMVNAETGGGTNPSTGTFIIDGVVNVTDNVTIFDTTPDSGLSGAGDITAGGTLTDNEGDDNFSGCGGGATCSGGNSPLPVELLEFTYTKTNQTFYLKWTTVSELNNKGFYIERSIDGQTFETIGFKEGNGNSNETIEYSFSIGSHSVSSYFRLRQEDFDGTSTNHEIIFVPADNRRNHFIYPNPFLDKIVLAGPSDEILELSISDISGKTIFTQRRSEMGDIEAALNKEISKLKSAESYFLRIRTNDGNVSTLKIHKR